MIRNGTAAVAHLPEGEADPALHGVRATTRVQCGGLRWPVTLFLITIIIPPEASLNVGTLFVSPQRLLLLVMLLPSVWMLLDRRAGSIRICDGLVAFHALWAMTTFMANHGVEQGVKSGGIYTVEVLGPYLLARVFVRDLNAFRGVVRLLTTVVIAMAIFTVPEALTGKHVLRDLFGLLFGSAGFEGPAERRLGLARAYGPFQHPILYGVFCSSGLALAWYSLPVPRVFRSAGIVLATCMSVSSGALLSLMVQSICIGWDQMTRKLPRRWVVFVAMISVCYILIEFMSNRGAVTVLISYLTLNPETGYWRQLIWDFGSAEVWRNPIIGIGFNEWERPDWMHGSSVDNFWLLTAMRHGIPAVLALAGAAIWISLGLVRQRITDERLLACRTGWLITIAALSTAAITVHFWGSALTFYCFLLGSIIWTIDAPKRRVGRDHKGGGRLIGSQRGQRD